MALTLLRSERMEASKAADFIDSLADGELEYLARVSRSCAWRDSGASFWAGSRRRGKWARSSERHAKRDSW